MKLIVQLEVKSCSWILCLLFSKPTLQSPKRRNNASSVLRIQSLIQAATLLPGLYTASQFFRQQEEQSKLALMGSQIIAINHTLRHRNLWDLKMEIGVNLALGEVGLCVTIVEISAVGSRNVISCMDTDQAILKLKWT